MNRATIPLTILTLCLASVPSYASGRTSLERLPLIIEDGAAPQGLRKLGPLRRYLSALRRAKHACELSTYAYGGNLSCRTVSGKMVYIGITAVPTRAPEFASVQDIRPNGVDSAYLPKSEFAAFLADLIKRQPSR